MNLNISTMGNFDIIHFENVSHYISTCKFIFYLIFGNIGNIFKILFFLQKPLKRCPCTIYVLFATISDFFTLNNIPLLNLLSNDWMIISFGPLSSSSSFLNETIIQNSFIPSEYSIKMCKIRNYFHMWSSNFSSQVLLLASINRFYMTIKKKNPQQKQHLTDFFSTLSSAYILCSITCVIWALISLHHLFNITIKYNICTSQNTILWTIGIVSLYICQSILMIIFGTLTILYRQGRSIWIPRRCQNHHEMIPMFNQLCQYCRNERSERHHVEIQLTSMIITEIILVILTLLPYTIYIVYRLISRNSIELMHENIIERLIQLTIFFEPSCGFYIYLFSLTTLKKRFLNIIRRRIGITQYY
jgi:hypothetical protein